jgi:hypothetical protein
MTDSATEPESSQQSHQQPLAKRTFFGLPTSNPSLLASLSTPAPAPAPAPHVQLRSGSGEVGTDCVARARPRRNVQAGSGGGGGASGSERVDDPEESDDSEVVGDGGVDRERRSW